MARTQSPRIAMLICMGLMVFGEAHAEDFRAECVQHYSITHRGVPTDVSSDYEWQTENAFDATKSSTSLIILDLPEGDFDWIDVAPVTARTSTFDNGEENSFSVASGEGEVDVMGAQISLRMLGDWHGEWTFELMGENRAILRFLTSTNTFDGVMIQISHAECRLSGTHNILSRDKYSAPPENYEERFWREAETAIRNHAPSSKQSLKSEP